MLLTVLLGRPIEFLVSQSFPKRHRSIVLNPALQIEETGRSKQADHLSKQPDVHLLTVGGSLMLMVHAHVGNEPNRDVWGLNAGCRTKPGISALNFA
jgi:hypothetical protein